MRWQSCGAALATVAMLAGCATGGGEHPRRPPVDVPDQVTTVDRSQIIGTWQCHELNPFPELPAQTSAITYAGDGTFHSVAHTQAREGFGAMTVNVTGKWSVQDGALATSEVKTAASSTDAFTNALAGIGSSLVNSMSSSQLQGAGNILKLTAHDMVLRPIGIEDPPVVACTR